MMTLTPSTIAHGTRFTLGTRVSVNINLFARSLFVQTFSNQQITARFVERERGRQVGRENFWCETGHYIVRMGRDAGRQVALAIKMKSRWIVAH
ncbi:hypothetical protein OUZ56_005120 [Daphnia magna]|uniref:Uncharacterized protein n=1 Tax=Daphnia magna TaxID=35525 RepID=A0ABQ9YRV9_9CRUS|nr:hypothetical protein OUZ56_005120 [Daphnia magna]